MTSAETSTKKRFARYELSGQSKDVHEHIEFQPEFLFDKWHTQDPNS